LGKSQRTLRLGGEKTNFLWRQKMKETQTLNRDLETIAWGLLFVLWGVTILFDFLPASVGLLGTGLILLGLNAARYLKGIPTKGGTTVLGLFTLVWGGLELAGVVLRLPFKLPVFSILLIVIGAFLLGSELLRVRQTRTGELQ
jgi:cytochrome c oxidase subunit IV